MKSPESPLHLSLVHFSLSAPTSAFYRLGDRGVTRSEDELQQVMRAVSRPLCLGENKWSGSRQVAHEEPRHRCWGEGAELVVSEERWTPEKGLEVGMDSNGSALWGEDGAQGSGAASLQK